MPHSAGVRKTTGVFHPPAVPQTVEVGVPPGLVEHARGLVAVVERERSRSEVSNTAVTSADSPEATLASNR
jgi:hypothetical protein